MEGSRDESRTGATSKMKHFLIIINGWKTLTFITKSPILAVAAVLNPLLGVVLVMLYKKSIQLF